MGDAARVQIPASAGALRSRRLLRLAGDERLVAQIRRGNEAAFEVAFERHGPPILAFCRHMLGSREEGEDAVQHTFAAAYRDLQRATERQITLKPWLFTIARNRCLSMLRARREPPSDVPELPTAGLAEQVEQRSELRQLLVDVRELPNEQRAALLLAELGDLSHAQVADVLGCEVPRVKALVYRARAGLVARRTARELPCEDVREQLASLSGGSLRRLELRFHLRACPGCRGFREQVKRQRQLLALGLPVAPGLGLKSSVLAAVGIGGASAGGGVAATTGGAVGGGALVGGSAVAKLAIVGALATGGAVAVVEQDAPPARAPAVGAGETAADDPTGGASLGVGEDATARPTGAGAQERGRSGRGVGLLKGRDEPRQRPAPDAGGPERGRLEADHGRGREAVGRRREAVGRGRGPINAPPAETPARRGPPEPKPGPQRVKPAPEAKFEVEPRQAPDTAAPGTPKATDPPPKAPKSQPR